MHSIAQVDQEELLCTPATEHIFREQVYLLIARVT